MYAKVEDQQYVNVPYQPMYTQPQTFQPPQNMDQVQQAISHIQIPDQVDFQHLFVKTTPCCCGVERQKSIFNIKGLGLLEIGYEQNVCCCPTACLIPCCFCLSCFDCNAHTYPCPQYIIQNDLIRMELWEKGIGKIKAKGIPILDFLQTDPNVCDMGYGHCQSAFPQVKISKPYDPKSGTLHLTPTPSPFPETVYSFLTVLSFLDLFNSTRNFQVEGLTQGRCTIVNTRSFSEAFAKICGLQGVCCLPDVDYPNFVVNFENVQQLDRIAILMGLVNYCIIKKWFILTHAIHTFAGEA